MVWCMYRTSSYQKYHLLVSPLGKLWGKSHQRMNRVRLEEWRGELTWRGIKAGMKKKNWWPTVWWNDERLKQIYYMAVFRSIVALSKTCNAKYHISFRASATKINPVPRHLIYVQWNEFKESDQWMRNRILLCVRSNKCRKMLNTKAFVKFLLGFVTLCI